MNGAKFFVKKIEYLSFKISIVPQAFHQSVSTLELLHKYFPDLSPLQIQHFAQLEALYKEWNERINVISRKDIDLLYERHILHSLGIAKVIRFKAQTKILDVGTGGGFPGIPLAILFPEAEFHLIDSIGKKIKVVEAVAEALGLQNVRATQMRAEQSAVRHYDFVVSRAVTRSREFWGWVNNKISRSSFNELNNGILHLKGGDLEEELTEMNKSYQIFALSNYFEEEFFLTKKVVYIPYHPAS